MLVLATGVSKNGKNKKKDGDPAALVLSLIFQLIILFIAIFAALKCNKGKSFWGVFWPMLGAIIFPEIYILQHVVRKTILEQPGYCQPIGL
jgi:hypothetical protein